MKRTRYFLILCAMLLALIACGGEIAREPTPIPPPPDLDGREVTPDPTSDTSTQSSDGPLTPPATPTGGEEPTPAGGSTSELTPEPTVFPTPESLPAPITGANVPIQILQSDDPLPPTTRDLLFLADGALQRWSQQRRMIETLIPSNASSRLPVDEPVSEHFAGDIISFQVNGDGKRAVAARLLEQEMLREGSRRLPLFRYEILFIDLVSLELWTLVPQVTNVNEVALSKDAQQLAFIAANADDGTPNLFDDETDDHLFYLSTGGGNAGSLVEIAPCQLFCGGPRWNPDSNLLSWGDGEGLWLFNIAGGAPQKLLNNQTTEINPATWLAFTPNSWAGNGRALLLNRGVWEATAHTIYDIPTGNLIDIPDSLISYGPFPSEFSWMPDGRILALRSFGRDGVAQHTVQIYRPDLEAGTIALDEQIELLPAASPLALLGQIYLEDGRFAFAIIGWGSDVPSEAGLYHLTSFSATPEKVNGMPVPNIPESPLLDWSGDGRQAIIQYSIAGGTYFARTGGESLIDLQHLLGDNPHAFTWLPEIIVP